MNRTEFLEKLEKKLSAVPQEERKKSIDFYGEIIDERIEEGQSEEDAVASLGDISEIAGEIAYSVPLPALIRERVKPDHKPSGWEIALLILGFPLWFPLLIAAGCIILAVYCVIWSISLAADAVAIGICAGSLGAFGAFVFSFFAGGLSIWQKVMYLGCGFLLAGLGLLLVLFAVKVTKWIIILTAKFGKLIKSVFIRREKEE